MAEHNHEHATTGHDHDFISANEAHFDAEAHKFEARTEGRELAKRVGKAITETYPDLFDEDKTEVMDFACGPGEHTRTCKTSTSMAHRCVKFVGLLSRELCPYVKSIVGVDISQNMVNC